jgi:hypothetical protein
MSTAILSILALSAVLAGSEADPAAGVQPQTSAAAAASPAASAVLKDDNKIICRSERHTGSRFPSRTCRTKKEWREWRTTKRRDMENAQAEGRPKSNNPRVF